MEKKELYAMYSVCCTFRAYMCAWCGLGYLFNLIKSFASKIIRYSRYRAGEYKISTSWMISLMCHWSLALLALAIHTTICTNLFWMESKTEIVKIGKIGKVCRGKCSRSRVLRDQAKCSSICKQYALNLFSKQ